MESMQDYLSNKALGASSVKTIATKSLLHFKEAEKKDTPSLNWGTNLHSFLLEPEDFLQRAVIEPALDRRTKAYKEWKQVNVDTSTILVSEDDMNSFEKIKQRLIQRELIHYVTEGQSEASHYSSAHGVDIKCRPDKIFKDRVVDLKTTRDLKFFSYDAKKTYRYDFSDVHTKRVIPEVKSYLFLAVESSAPFDVAIFEFTDVSLNETQTQWESAIKRYEEALRTDTWPGLYGSQVQEIW